MDYPSQVKEKVVEWQGRTITKILAAANKFWDKAEKDEEDTKDCGAACSVIT